MAAKASARLTVISGQLASTVQESQCVARVDEFQYTLPNSLLTHNQREFYERNGYLVVKGLIGDAHLDSYREHFHKICDREVKVPGLVVMKDVAIVKSGSLDGEMAINKLQYFHHYDPLFDYCLRPELRKYVECFCGPDIIAINSMLINKPPDPGTKTSRHPLHQDMFYFRFNLPDRIVCSWTAMEKVHRANGCLVVLPGTHKGPLKKHAYPEWENGVNKLYYGIKDYDTTQPMVHLEMEKGDTVFFHPLLIHGSGANKTQGFRKAISGHYAASSVEVVPISGEAFDESIKKEMIEFGSRLVQKSKPGAGFDDYWKNQTRLVQGSALKFA